MEYVFRIDIRPRPKQRPRFFNGHIYTPHETQDYECALRKIVERRMQIDGAEMFQKWAKIQVTFTFCQLKKPKPFHNSRPDLDNLLKAVLDAMNGTLYRDDAIILSVTASKQ